MNKILLQLSEKSIKILGGFIAFALILIGLVVSVTPIVNNMQANTANINKLSAQKAQIVNNIERYSSLQEYSKELDATAVYLKNKFPEGSNVPDLISDISSAATKAGIESNKIANVTVGTPTQIVEPLGEAGDTICTALKPGDFAIIIPDIKNSTAEKKIYIMCSEEALKNVNAQAFYNAATEKAARTCQFKPDLSEGKKFFISVEKCGTGTVLPALRAGSVQPIAGGERIPAKPILAIIQGEVAQMPLTITVDSGVGVDAIANFVTNLYDMRRAISINTIKTGVSADREKTTYTVITGFVYSHTKTITADELNKTQESGK